MKNISPKIIPFKPLLILSCAATLSACASSIANRTPIDIASNSVRHTDSLSGVSEALAPRVKAFSARRSAVRGTAQLRTAGPFTDETGKVLRGGAYIDVQITYKSATPHPAESRRYDTVMWPGGQTALVANWGGSVLDCREDVRSIPQYTPIYGAFGYGHVHDDYCSHRGYGHSGWGRGYGHYGHGHVHDDACGHDVGGDGGHTDVTPTTNPRPSRPTSRPDRPRRPGVTRPHPDGPGTEPDGPRVPIHRPVNRPGQPQPRALPRTSKKIVSRPRSGLAPSSQPGPQTVPQPTYKPARKVVSRPRPQPVSKPVPTSKPASKPSVSRRDTPRRTRTVSPRTRTKTVNRKMRYYPRDRYYDTRPRDYVVRRSCDRQETLRIFVPRQRLDAASTNGLIVYVRPRAGQEEVLSLPPNYINGFALAAWSPQGERLTIPGDPRNFSAPVSPQLPVAKSPRQPGANTPIIYGED